MPDPVLAFIGGSGLYDIEDLAEREELTIPTPFGDPSGPIIVGLMGRTPVAFVPRHGIGHRLSPTEVPARANIYALKTLGVQRIVSISAVGSLAFDVRPKDVVIPDQIIDRTKSRPSTFFGDGIAAHVGFADPFCPDLSSHALGAARATLHPDSVHQGGTYVAIEGPQFSTRAESRLYRSWGANIIGMTALPEAKLAREAEICYATLAFATDYDVWHESAEDVTVEMVIANLLGNVATAKEMIRNVAGRVPTERSCPCKSVLENAIITDRSLIPAETRSRLEPIIGRYLV